MEAWYEFDAEDMLFVATEGVGRRIKGLTGDHIRGKGRDTFDKRICECCNRMYYDQWGSDIEAAAAEMAVAFFYEGVDCHHTFLDHPDYEGDYKGIQVRHTLHDRGGLLVYETDPDDRFCILVTGRLPVLTVRGGLYAGEVKQHDEWWYENLKHIKLIDPCWRAPQSVLLDPPPLVEELPDELFPPSEWDPV